MAAKNWSDKLTGTYYQRQKAGRATCIIAYDECSRYQFEGTSKEFQLQVRQTSWFGRVHLEFKSGNWYLQ